MEEYTCQDCKYYFPEEQYCTTIFIGKKISPNEPICSDSFFEKGVFNDRFWIKAKPLGISTGYFYVLIDREGELKDYDGEPLIFSHDFEAETICDFLNKQDKRIKELEKEKDIKKGGF